MARTQAADYETRRDVIVEKAARLFARNGFRGASVADLAGACETSKSLIYHYYSSKEDILFAVMASHIDQLSQDVAEVIASDAPPSGRLRTLVRKFMDHYVGAADRQKVLLNDLDQLPSDKRRRIVRQQREIVDAVTNLFTQLDQVEPEGLVQARARAMMLFGMINWTHTWFDPSGPMTPQDIADMAVRMATEGRVCGEQER